MATKKFQDDDLEDYDDEYWEDEDDAWEEAEKDKEQYTFVDPIRKVSGAAPRKNQRAVSEVKPAPVVSSAPALAVPGYTLNQVSKLSKLRSELEMPYAVSSWFLEKASKMSSPKNLADSLNLDGNPVEPAPTVFVVIGHVDAGKSTLMAQLVSRFGVLTSSPELHASSSKKSRQNLAWELDVGQDEREHGVTIDAKSKPLVIEGRCFVAIDAPGHADYVPSMLLGAMQADAAVLVIDCVKFDSGFSRGGQTKEHVSLIRALGIHQLIIVLNKIDMIEPDDRFRELESIKAQLRDFILDEMKFHSECVFIPISAILGENIFKGPEQSLAQAILALKPKNHGPVHHSVCIPIVDVNGDRISGRIECGSVHEKEKLMVLPSKQLVTIHPGSSRVPGSYLESIEYRFVDSGSAGSPTSASSAYIHAGSVLVDPLFALPNIECVEVFMARILILNDDFMPMVRGQTVTINVHTSTMDASISRLVEKVHKPGVTPKCLVKGDLAIVEVTVRKGQVVVVEPNETTRVTGRVVIRDRGVTIAAGLVIK
jgi:elongation factor 1 alpha-like protein